MSAAPGIKGIMMILFVQSNYDSPLMTVSLFSLLAILVYLMPVVIAAARSHHQKWLIVLLNVFAGWTIIGWIGALIWSLKPVKTAHEIKREKRLNKFGNNP